MEERHLENSIAEVFEVGIVESDGNRKYTYPPRDGSFAIDATLTIDDLVERGSQTVEKVFGAGEDELAGATVEYFDVDSDYKKLPQPYNRPVGLYDVTRSKKKRTFNTILSLSASQAVELATLEWVSWFNHHRLLGPIGHIPPAEAEANYWREQERQAINA